MLVEVLVGVAVLVGVLVGVGVGRICTVTVAGAESVVEVVESRVSVPVLPVKEKS